MQVHHRSQLTQSSLYTGGPSYIHLCLYKHRFELTNFLSKTFLFLFLKVLIFSSSTLFWVSPPIWPGFYSGCKSVCVLWSNNFEHFVRPWFMLLFQMRSLDFFFSWPNPSSRTMALGLTQPPIEMSTRNILGIFFEPIV
jgi:hypothetical protein